MAQFLKQLLLFALITVFLFEVQKWMVNSKTTPFWGNEHLYHKVEFLKVTDQKYDLMLLGSSLTYRQIDPSILKGTLGLESFNLGIAGLRNPETWYAIEHFLEILPQEKRPEYMVIELQKFGSIHEKNANSMRETYYLDIPRTTAAVLSFGQKRKFKQISLYLQHFLRNETKQGLIPLQLETDGTYRSSLGSVAGSLEKHDGYFPLEFETTPDYPKRKADFLKNSEELTKRKKEVTEKLGKSTHTTAETLAINRIIKLCREKGIEPIILKPIRKPGLDGLYDEIENTMKVDVANPNEYPQFYSIENSFDEGHLDLETSKEYAQLIADKIADEMARRDLLD